MYIKPLDDRVLVEPTEQKGKEEGFIIIPETSKDQPIIGKVIEVGTDEELNKLISEGEKLLFSKYSGEDITIGGKDFKIIQRSDILAIIQD